MGFLLVFLGAGLGGALRHGVNLAFGRPGGFPFATLGINVFGSILMGAAVELFAFRASLPPGWRLFLTTGVLGGFTTFSTFSLEAARLHQRGQTAQAALYVAASAVLSIGGLFAAMALVRRLAHG